MNLKLGPFSEVTIMLPPIESVKLTSSDNQNCVILRVKEFLDADEKKWTELLRAGAPFMVNYRLDFRHYIRDVYIWSEGPIQLSLT